MFLTPILVALSLSLPSNPDTTETQDTLALQRSLAAKEAALVWKTGDISLPGGKAVLHLPAGFRYLSPSDAKTVLEMIWGNPSGDGTLGMVFGPGQQPSGDSSWGVVLSYEDDGHVDDKDAESIDYEKLLGDMKKQADESNAVRVKEGFSAVHLVGWAERPAYDRSSHKLFWAKELDFGSHAHTLNYNVRVLGRAGVLNLNAVSSMANMGVVQSGMRQLLPEASFTAGNTYADFDSGKDKLAEFGIAALVAGGVGVAAKVGLFKGFFLLLLAAKKFLVVAVLGLAAGIRAWLARRKAREQDARFGQDLSE